MLGSVLLTNFQLFEFSGSELNTLDIAEELTLQGYRVVLGTFRYPGVLKPRLDKLGLEILDLSNPISRNKKFNILWMHHNSTVNAVGNLGIAGQKSIFFSMSPYEPLEVPPSSNFSLMLANSIETKRKICSNGISPDKIRVFPNPCGRQYFDEKSVRIRTNIKKIVVISSHVPRELAQIPELFNKIGVGVDFFGYPHNPKEISINLLNSYDVIITIGRTVQAALALGIPVYCYDRFGGPGYITTKNLELSSEFNFSGRCVKIKRRPETIYTEILTGFNDVLLDIFALREIAKNRFSIQKEISEILSSL